MILTDGTDTVTITQADETLISGVDMSSTRTAGGNIRTTISGERFKLAVQVRATQAQFRSFMDLMKGNAADYFYTPESTSEWATLYSSITFPIAVSVSNVENNFYNSEVVYISFTVEAIGYV